ncbi:MAG TPA: chemotaxis-specific protein-glutamate methyltransferase CheB [Allosphingosinicella sp.]|nr:chemotaxis-specific protein-glutamate methyltransferase CheB [Allosphingosinicella sp.]
MTAAARPPAETRSEPPLRLMIVDDSSVARAVLSRMVGSNPDFELVAVVGSAVEALDALKTVRVDIVLLDVEMPGGNGLDALPDILRTGAGARVLIVSSMAEEGAETAVRALSLGAADALPKPGAGVFGGRFADVLADRLRRIGRAVRLPQAEAAVDPSDPIRLRPMGEGPLGCVALGSSTGGFHALTGFLRVLPAEIKVPILVTQHLPPVFMASFARQLEAASGRLARVAEEGQVLRRDVIHVAPGDAHLCVQRHGADVAIRLDRKAAPSGCLPSVDPMLSSVAEAYGDGGIGIILSGMGRDGLVGGRRIVEQGGSIFAQDRATSAVWGMPRAVAEAGLASAVLPPSDLARRVALRAGLQSWK